MNILITGGNGQLGRALAVPLRKHAVVALAHRALDVSDAEAVHAAFVAHHPDAVVHAAALTDTGRCEHEPELAHAVNARGAENVAREAAAMGAFCVAVSTNEVFDGVKPDPYRESDEPRPLNAYAASKHAGERLAMTANGDVRIVRTAWVYGEGESNFIQKTLAGARAGRVLRLVTDEVATPTSAADLASAIGSMIETDAPAGIYHLTNEGLASRYEWAAEILRLAGMIHVQVEPITTAELRASGYDGPRKPAHSVLANTRARAQGIVLRPWRDALAARFAGAKVLADG